MPLLANLAVYLLAVADTPPIELLPAGQWQVEYAKSSCIISRAFGAKPNTTLFGLKPAPNSDVVTMLVIQASPKGRGVGGTADVRLSSGLVPAPAYFSSVTINGVRVTTINLPRTALDGLAKGDSIAIKAAKVVDVLLAPTSFDKALKALNDCESDLLTSWGFDKGAQAEIASPPKGSLQGLLRNDDYPDKAIDANASGSVGFRLKIEADGSIGECDVLETSGNRDLDGTTCAVMKKRAHYQPAMGQDGKPRWTYTFGRVTWMLEY